jgi:membrane fusion protein (multidrug efflux system)
VENKGAAGSVLIPFKSVVEQMGEYFVYVVGDSSKVSQRKVQLGARIGDKIVARDGVKDGEKIVTEGVQKIRDGVKVQAGTQGTKPPAQAGAPQGK